MRTRKESLNGRAPTATATWHGEGAATRPWRAGRDNAPSSCLRHRLLGASHPLDRFGGAVELGKPSHPKIQSHLMCHLSQSSPFGFFPLPFVSEVRQPLAVIYPVIAKGGNLNPEASSDLDQCTREPGDNIGVRLV